MPSDELRRKLDAYGRKKLRKQLLPEFKESMAHVLNVPLDEIDVLDIEETLAIREWRQTNKIYEKRKRELTFQRFWSPDEEELARKFLEDLRIVSPNKMFLLARGLALECGYVRVDLHTILNRAFHLTELNNEDIRATAEDHSCHMEFSYNTEYINPPPYKDLYYVRLEGAWWEPILEQVGVTFDDADSN